MTVPFLLFRQLLSNSNVELSNLSLRCRQGLRPGEQQSGMMNISHALLLGIGLTGSTLAQAPVPNRAPDGESTGSFECFTRELFLRGFETHQAQIEAEVAKPHDAEYRERHLIDKMNKIAGAWDQFVSLYNDRRVFDMKAAKELSKAFHELETSGYWPKPERK